MRSVIFVFFFLFISCQTKDCSEWYSHISAHTVTEEENNNEKIEGWYKTDFFKKELNFLIRFIYSADGYEGCDSKTMIHEVLKDSIFISSESYLIIDEDTLSANSNLYEYFEMTEIPGHLVFEFNKDKYELPEFESPNNTFYFSLKLTDNTYLKDSCVFKFL